jgi:hypothetical protein
MLPIGDRAKRRTPSVIWDLTAPVPPLPSLTLGGRGRRVLIGAGIVSLTTYDSVARAGILELLVGSMTGHSCGRAPATHDSTSPPPSTTEVSRVETDTEAESLGSWREASGGQCRCDRTDCVGGKIECTVSCGSAGWWVPSTGRAPGWNEA